MKMVIIAVVLTLALVPNVVHGRSGGAPDEACASVSPSLAGHVVGPQVTDSPFTLTISGSPSYYDPGCQYSCELIVICEYSEPLCSAPR